jgi:hypothetical protein
MPTTRGDSQHQQYYQNTSPKVSSANVYFGVSEPFCNQSNPDPIRSSKAVRECLNDVAFCMGERVSTDSRFTVSPTTLPTGAYGQEARFQCDPNQRNASGYTIGRIIRAAKETEERIWNSEEGRNQIRKSLAKFASDKHIHEQSTSTSSGLTEATIGRDPRSTGGDDHGQECDKRKTPPIHRRKNGGNHSRRLSQHSDYGTIAPSRAAKWFRKEAGHTTNGLERTIPSNTTSSFTTSEITDPSTSSILPRSPDNA